MFNDKVKYYNFNREFCCPRFCRAMAHQRKICSNQMKHQQQSLHCVSSVWNLNVLCFNKCFSYFILHVYICIANEHFNPSRDRSAPNLRKQSFLKKINGRKFCFCFWKFLNVCFICQKPLLSPVLGPVYIYTYVCIMHTRILNHCCKLTTCYWFETLCFSFQVFNFETSQQFEMWVCDNDFDTTTRCKINLTFQFQKPPNLKVVLEW